eukprot:EC788583.1.p2 GENE.EC788583.1~~EC788583.1.p2  ORF type:complete len:113 (-),score=8.51 EC788583.1:149-487(-)
MKKFTRGGGGGEGGTTRRRRSLRRGSREAKDGERVSDVAAVPLVAAEVAVVLPTAAEVQVAQMWKVPGHGPPDWSRMLTTLIPTCQEGACSPPSNTAASLDERAPDDKAHAV